MTANEQSSPIRAALVTGAADRIGATIAERLAAAGWKVVVHHRNSEEKARATVARIVAGGGDAVPLRADLADRSERAALVGDAARAFGPLALLVNNAFRFEPDSIFDLDEALWDAHFAVHAEAPVFLARDFAAQLPDGTDGTDGNIVNIIDERVLHLSPANFSYTLSKTVLWAATRTLAQSLAPRIRVNAVGPGPTLPSAGQSEESFAASQARLPLRRGASADDIAEAVLYLVNSRAITGQMLALDGGEHLEYPERRGPTARKK